MIFLGPYLKLNNNIKKIIKNLKKCKNLCLIFLSERLHKSWRISVSEAVWFERCDWWQLNEWCVNKKFTMKWFDCRRLKFNEWIVKKVVSKSFFFDWRAHAYELIRNLKDFWEISSFLSVFIAKLKNNGLERRSNSLKSRPKAH